MNNKNINKLLIKKLLFKIIVTFALMIIFRGVTDFISPIVANQLAMEQMYNYPNSSLWIQLYTYLMQYSWLLAILYIILVFKNDITLLFTLIRSKRNNEEN